LFYSNIRERNLKKDQEYMQKAKLVEEKKVSFIGSVTEAKEEIDKLNY